MSKDPWIRYAKDAPLENFEIFLSARGFRPVDTVGDRAVVYEARDKTKVLLPQSKDFDDFSLRIADLVDTVARILGKDRDSIARLISSVGYDLFKIRTGIGRQSFSVDLDEALDTLHNGYDIVDYSAVYAASNTPPKFIKGRRTKEVSSYLDSVRMGQTEPGSFILTLLLPVADGRDLMGTKDSTFSLGRKVSDAIVKGLKSSKAALNPDAKKDIESRPLTANFLSALAGIVKSSPSLEIGVDQKTTGVANHFRFKRNDEEALLELAQHLTPRSEAREVTIVGTVINVTEPRGQKNGFFLLESEIEGSLKRVKVPFSRGERQDVIKGFDEKADLRLRVRGRLTKSDGGRLSLESHSGMTLSRRGKLT